MPKNSVSEIFSVPCQQQTGDQEDESQLGSCVPKDTPRPLSGKSSSREQGIRASRKTASPPAPDLVNGPLVPRAGVPGGDWTPPWSAPQRSGTAAPNTPAGSADTAPKISAPARRVSPTRLHKPHQLGQHPRDGQHRHTAHPLTSCSSHCMRGREGNYKKPPSYDGRAGSVYYAFHLCSSQSTAIRFREIKRIPSLRTTTQQSTTGPSPARSCYRTKYARRAAKFHIPRAPKEKKTEERGIGESISKKQGHCFSYRSEITRLYDNSHKNRNTPLCSCTLTLERLICQQNTGIFGSIFV